jgi:hypothetical protein
MRNNLTTARNQLDIEKARADEAESLRDVLRHDAMD